MKSNHSEPICIFKVENPHFDGVPTFAVFMNTEGHLSFVQGSPEMFSWSPNLQPPSDIDWVSQDVALEKIKGCLSGPGIDSPEYKITCLLFSALAEGQGVDLHVVHDVNSGGIWYRKAGTFLDEEGQPVDASGEVDSPEEFFLENGDSFFRSIIALHLENQVWQQSPIGSVFVAQLVRELEVDRGAK